MAIPIDRTLVRRWAAGSLLPLAAVISALLLFSHGPQTIPADRMTDTRTVASPAPARAGSSHPSDRNVAPATPQPSDREQAQRRELLHLLIFHGAGPRPFGFFR